MTKKCAVCGKINFRSSIYCSINCYHRDYYFPVIKKTCEFCGKEFETRQAKKKKCCSTQCSLKKYAKENKEYLKKYRHDKHKELHPRKTYYLKCVICKNDIVTYRKRQKYCGNKCRVVAYRSTEKGKLSRIIDYHRRRDDVKLNAFTKDDWLFCLHWFNNSCAYCGATGNLHQDHFIPVRLGGRYSKKNIVPACPKCNFSKNGKHPKDFVQKEIVIKINNYFDIL